MLSTQPKRVIDTLPGSLPDAQVPLEVDTEAIAKECISRLGKPDNADFTESAMWRDLFALTGTARTFYSSTSIVSSWTDVCATHNPGGFALVPGSSQRVDVGSKSSWVEAKFVFETYGEPAALCSGFVSLVPDPHGRWKIWLLRTILEGLKGFPNVDVLDPREAKRPIAAAGCTKGDGELVSVDCVIVGAGQAGLATAGRLHALGVNYILIEKNPDIGDNWKTRYESAKRVFFTIPLYTAPIEPLTSGSSSAYHPGIW